MNIKIYALKIKGGFFALMVWACFIGEVSAQVMDNIILNPVTDDRVNAIIKLSIPVEYLRHFPENQGQHLEIYFNILQSPPIYDPLKLHELRTSPPSDLIPGFTVEVRDLPTGPKLVVEFSRPAKYSVRIGKDERSFVLTIQSDKVKPASNAEPAVVAASAVAASLPLAAGGQLGAQTTEIDNQAEPLLVKGRAALQANQFGVAID